MSVLSRSTADVEDGRIVLRASLADLLVARRIPGGAWDSTRKAMTYPATGRHARFVRATIARLDRTSRFEALCTPAPASEVLAAAELERSAAAPTESAPRPESPALAATAVASREAAVVVPHIEIVLPDGLATRPWRHQKAAYKFCLDHFERGQHGLLLAMGMGCIEGDAELIVNRGGNARRMRLRYLHYKFHGGPSGTHSKRRWDRSIHCYTRSLINGELRLNRIVNVVAQGAKSVLRLTLASGKSLRLTADHEVACPEGRWVAAGNLKPGDAVLTNGTPTCKSCGGTHRVTTYRYAKHVGICRSCIGGFRRKKGKGIDKDGYVRLYGMHWHPRANKAGQVYEHIVVMERVLGRPITASEHVHHKNHVRHDNRTENLEVLPATEHYEHHGKCGGYLHLDGGKVHFVPKSDTVISIEPDGETDVYDIQMADPGRNFVANGVIVHNCGKTLAAEMVMLGTSARRTLIVCPLRVVPVWEKQLRAHVAIPLVVAALDDDCGSVASKQQEAAAKLALADATERPYVAVINYDSAWRSAFAAWAEKQRWDLVVADEAHKIKAPGGKASLFFKRMRTHARYRLALTGTPTPHSPMDIYAIFRFLNIGILGPSFAAFRQRYAVMGGYQRKQIVGYQRQEELTALMRRITFRVGKEVLDLPPETDVTYHCDLGPEARRIYKDLEEDFVAQIRDGVITATNAMVKLLRLQQVTGGCVPTDDGVAQRVDTAKQDLLTDTLDDIGSEEPVVVFCRFRADLDAVHEACQKLRLSSLELSGRADDLERWQAGGAQVLAVQIASGGTGVDLTRARYSVYFSVGFSFGDYDQARCRVHRPGQSHPVQHIHLIARNTVDVKLMRALERRAEVVEAILAELKR